MKYTTEQFEKLPKWAQNEIKVLAMNLESTNRRLAEFEGQSETNTFISHGLSKQPLPNNAHIEFHTANSKVSVYIREEGVIDINTTSNKTTVILPRASNSFYISFANL
jgi:hypothetical protein